MNLIRLGGGGWLLPLLVLVPTLGWSMPPVPDFMRCNVEGNGLNDGPAAVEAAARQVADWFWRSDAMLDQAVKEWNVPTCVFDDGRPRLDALGLGYDVVFSDEKDWSKSLARVEYLKRKYPMSAFIAIAEAEYWVDYAWNARGEGYASSVSPEGWKLFQERLEKAEKTLIGAKPYAAAYPDWYAEMIIVQSALDRPAEDRDKTFLEGAYKYKTYYPIYYRMGTYLSPKWGGTWETVDNFVKWAVENTKAIDGNTMYARLYWSASGGLPRNVSMSMRHPGALI